MKMDSAIRKKAKERLLSMEDSEFEKVLKQAIDLLKTKEVDLFKKYHECVKNIWKTFDEIEEFYKNDNTNLKMYAPYGKQFYRNAEHIGYLLGCEIVVEGRDTEPDWPYKVSFEYDGIEYFSIESEISEELQKSYRGGRDD